MASGKQIGNYLGRTTSTTISPGPGNAITLQANVEGTGSGDRGEFTYALTYSVEMEPEAKSGTFSQCGLVNMKDGTRVGFRNQGTWEESSAGKISNQGTGQLSDGTTYATEFEVDLTTRTWTGKLYESS